MKISGGHPRKEAADLGTKQRSLVAHGAGRSNDLDRSVSRFACTLADVRDTAGQSSGTEGGLLRPARDFLRRGRLLLNRRSHSSSTFIHFSDGQTNGLYCIDSLYGHLLNRRNLTSKLFRRFGGLARK